MATSGKPVQERMFWDRDGRGVFKGFTGGSG